MLFKLFGFLEFHYWDILDIAIVSYIFYKMIIIIRDTKAIPLLMGLLVVVFVTFITNLMQLSALMWIVDTFKTIWVIAFLIIFQPEIRRALAKAGQSKWFKFIYKAEKNKTYDILINAIYNLSKKKIGALIVMVKEAPLDSIIETGTPLNALINESLIETIFTPPTPLHDGAVVIKGDYIIAAGCILPITQNQFLDKSLGLRHRAALGISEESDAIAIVVSEETGNISLAVEGNLLRNITSDELKEYLITYFSQEENGNNNKIQNFFLKKGAKI